MAAIFISPLINLTIGKIIDTIIRSDKSESTLEEFLRIYSEEFARNVERIMTNEFFKENIIDIYSHVKSSQRSFSSYIHTKNYDDLKRTWDEIDTAYNRLEAVCKVRIFDSKPNNSILKYLEFIDNGLKLLQAIASWEILVMCERSKVQPSFSEEAMKRIDEYIIFGLKLQNLLVDSQELRMTKTPPNATQTVKSRMGYNSFTYSKWHWEGAVFRDGKELHRIGKLFDYPHDTYEKGCWYARLTELANHEIQKLKDEIKNCEATRNLFSNLSLWQQIKGNFAIQIIFHILSQPNINEDKIKELVIIAKDNNINCQYYKNLTKIRFFGGELKSL